MAEARLSHGLIDFTGQRGIRGEVDVLVTDTGAIMTAPVQVEPY